MPVTPASGVSTTAGQPGKLGPVLHVITGFGLLAVGISLLVLNQSAEGLLVIGSGLTFLGVGSGASLSTPSA